MNSAQQELLDKLTNTLDKNCVKGINLNTRQKNALILWLMQEFEDITKGHIA